MERGGERRPLTLDRPVTLLVYLSLRGDWVRRSDLALLYRPHAAEDEANNYLRKLVHRARKLWWAEGLEVEAERLRWLVSTDVQEFRLNVAERRWAAAAALYGGPFLGGAAVRNAPGFSAWQDLEAGALRSAWIGASEACAAEELAAGRPDAAAELLARVLEADPLAEEQLQAYMHALAASGRVREALHAYESFRSTLEEEVGVDPLEATIVLADDLRRSYSAGPRPSSTAPTGLPKPLTPFVGRQRELAELAALLRQQGARLVSIVGLGGMGKTRLAVEAARRFQEAGEGEVSYVPLTGLTDPAALLPRMVEALGLECDEADAERVLLTEVRGRPRLMVLDNFESVLPAAPALTRLLEEAPDLRLLVTTREALPVLGEVRLELGGLQVPEPDEPATSDFAAVGLFVQGAARAAPQFATSDSTLRTVADICRQLEGMPLAIELAASWTRVLSLDELREQFGSGSAVLTTAMQDVPERHTSVWQVFEHSWARLTEAQQRALARLTTFRGGFTLHAAEAVAGTDLGMLLSLLNRLLVRRQSEGRFVLHELVRQYAEWRAADSELAEAQDAHGAYFVQLLASLAGDFKAAGAPRALGTVQADAANFEVAWHHAVARQDLEALEGARTALGEYFYYRGRLEPARAAFGAALEALAPLAQGAGPRARRAARLRGLLLTNLAEKEYGSGEFEVAAERGARALAALGAVGNATDLANAQLVQANGLVKMARYEEARPLFQAALSTGLRTGDPYLEGAAHNGLANVLSYLKGDVRRAEKHYRLSLEAHERNGDLEGTSGALTNMGACRFDLGDYSEAERLWAKAAAAAAEMGFREREAALLNNLGALAEARGELETARANYERSLTLRRELGNRTGSANVLFSMGRLALRSGETVEARHLMQEAHDHYRWHGDLPGMTQCHSYLTRILAELERFDDAEDHLARATELALEMNSHVEMLGVLYSGALLLEARGLHGPALRAAHAVAEGAKGSVETLRTQARALAGRLAPEGRSEEMHEKHPTVTLVARLVNEVRAGWNATGTA